MKSSMNKDLVHQNLKVITDSLGYDIKDMYIQGRSDIFMRIPGYDYEVILKAYLQKSAISICVRPKYQYSIDMSDIIDEFKDAGFRYEMSRKSPRIITYKDCNIEETPSQELINWVDTNIANTINILNKHYE